MPLTIPAANGSISKIINSKQTIVENKKEKIMIPGTNDSYIEDNFTLGINRPNANNIKTPFGILSTNNDNKTLIFTSNDGMILWEAQLAEYPDFQTYPGRYNITFETAAYIPELNTIVVMAENISGPKYSYYLIAYDATTGVPITATPTADTNPFSIFNVPIWENTNTISMVYNPITSLIFIYFASPANTANSQYKVINFNKTSYFTLLSNNNYFKWKLGGATNNIAARDVMITVSVDEENGNMYGLFFQLPSGSSTTNNFYIVQFDSTFSTKSDNSTLSLKFNFSTNESKPFYSRILSTPGKIFNNKNGKKYWYGFYNKINTDTFEQQLTPVIMDTYYFVVEINNISSEITHAKMNLLSSSNAFPKSFDFQDDKLLFTYMKDRTINGNLMSFDGTSIKENISLNSSRIWPSDTNDFSSFFSYDSTKNDNLKFTSSTKQIFFQYVDNKFWQFGLNSLIAFNYRTFQLGWAYSSNNILPSEIDESKLKKFKVLGGSEGDEDGLWAFKKRNLSNSVNWETSIIENFKPDNKHGLASFSFTYTYTILGKEFTNIIPNIILEGFSSTTEKTQLFIKQIDLNSYNSLFSIIDPSFHSSRTTRPEKITIDQIKTVLMDAILFKPLTFNKSNIILEEADLEYDYFLGTITFSPIIDLYFDANINVVNKKLTFPKFTINGLYQSSATYFDDTSDNIYDGYVTASELFDNKKYLNDFLYEKIMNIPLGFDPQANIIYDVKDVIVDDINGIITLKNVYLNKWHNEEGALETKLSTPTKIVIKGFLCTNAKTIIRPIYQTYADNVQPFDLSEEDVKNIIKETSINLVKNFTNENIIFDTPIIYDNLNGTITASPSFNLTYDDSGAVITKLLNMGTITMKNFKAATPTELLKDWNIGEPYSYSSTLAKEENRDKLLFLISSNIINLPTNHLDENKNFTLDSIIIDKLISDNLNGTLSFDITLTKYYNGKSEFSSIPVKYPNLVISGFKTQFGETSFPSVYSIANTAESPQNIDNDTIKKLLISIGENIPLEATYKNITFKNPIINPLKGEIILTPMMNIWLDDKGQLNTINKEFPIVTLTDFKKIAPTSADPDRWILGNASLIPQEVSQDKKLLKETILFKIKNPPPSFSTKDIEITGITSYSNKDGTVSVNFKLTKYYDENGFLKNDNNMLVQDFIISGYYKVSSKTTIPLNININMPEISPQDVSDQLLKNILIDNFSFLPPKFSPSNISFSKENLIKLNLNGVIQIINPSINYYFNDALDVSTEKNQFEKINIYGFKKTNPTSLLLDGWNIGDQSIVASEFIKNPNDVKRLISGRIINPVSDFNYDFDDPSKRQDIQLTNLYANNKLGSVVVDVKLNRYYDSAGFIRTSGWEPNRIIINGFSIVKGETSFSKTFTTSFPDKQPSEFNNENGYKIIKEILFDASYNIPGNLTPENIRIDPTSIIYNNILGTIQITPYLPSWYDENSNYITTEKKFSPVTIDGFLKTQATSILNQWNIGDINVIPEDAMKDETNIKNMISNNILFKPINFDNQTDIKINKMTPNNLEGILAVSFTINKYYDSLGNLKTTNFNNGKDVIINISNYKNSSSTSISNEGWNIGSKVLLASNLNDEKYDEYIKTLIYSKVFNFPPNFDYLKDILISNIETNNVTGEITLDVKIKGGYGQDGIIDLEGDSANLNKKITISGFRQISPTIINSKVSINSKIDIPESVTVTELKNIIFNNKFEFFRNLTDDFSLKNIHDIKIENTNNISGIVVANISLLNYYQTGNGNIIIDEAKPLEAKVTISGFKKINPTAIKNKELLIPDFIKFLSTTFNENINYINNWKKVIIHYQHKFFKNLPDDFSSSNISNVEILENDNIKGTSKIKIYLNNVYMNDSNGSINTVPIPFEFLIKGFKIINQTEIEDNLNIINIKINEVPKIAHDYIAGDIVSGNVDGTSVLKILHDNYYRFINNIPTIFDPNNDLDIKGKVSYDNLQGTFTANVIMNNYYDSNGDIVNTSNKELWKSKVITFSGFKKISETTNNLEIIYNLFGHISSSISLEQAKELITNFKDEIFLNLPPISISELSEFISIESLTPNDAEGSLSITFKLGYYYDYKGDLIRDITKAKTLNVKIIGFWQQLTSTYIFDSVHLKIDELASSLIEQNPKYIYDLVNSYKSKIFINAPNDLIFDYELITTDNSLGIIKIKLILKSYYDSNGTLVSTTTSGILPMTKEVTFSGYQKVTPTMIGSETIGDNSIMTANIGSSINFLPSYYQNLNIKNAEELLQDLVISNIFNGTINNQDLISPIISNFIFYSNTANDSTKSLVVSFDITNYITLEDGVILGIAKPINLTITGFGGYSPSLLSKDTTYILTITAIVYLSILITFGICLLAYKFIKWKR